MFSKRFKIGSSFQLPHATDFLFTAEAQRLFSLSDFLRREIRQDNLPRSGNCEISCSWLNDNMMRLNNPNGVQFIKLANARRAELFYLIGISRSGKRTNPSALSATSAVNKFILSLFGRIGLCRPIEYNAKRVPVKRHDKLS
jgi:hypothetical protein